jgi:hypothetical protein
MVARHRPTPSKTFFNERVVRSIADDIRAVHPGFAIAPS